MSAEDSTLYDDSTAYDDTTGAASAFPLNRVVAFLGPYVAIASGAASTWLLVHAHFLATFHVNHDSLASALSQVAVFVISTLVVWAGHHKWLTGWQQHEAAKTRAMTINNISQPVSMPETMAATGNHPDGGDYDPAMYGPDGSVADKPGIG